MHNQYNTLYWGNQGSDYQRWQHNYWSNQQYPSDTNNKLEDFGRQPFVINIEKAAKQNNAFRKAIWTGENLQVTLMSINVGDDVGLEVHPNVDQFVSIEDGEGYISIGDTRDNLYFRKRVSAKDAIMIPAGKWHNLINTGNRPLKLFTIYAPPEHPFGTIHATKMDAMKAE
nr:cupin domain-containing protein [Sporosarcina cyprini]